jgi:hypothetical protein
MKGFRVISLHPKYYTKLKKFACLSKTYCHAQFWGLGEVAFPPQKSALSNVLITDSSLGSSGGHQWHNFHAKISETLSDGSEVYLGSRETAW